MKSIFRIVVSLSIVLLIDLWVENSSVASSIFSVLEPIFDGFKIPFIIVILIAIPIFFSVKEKIDGLNSTLDSEMEMLVRKNTELSRYRRQEVISTILSQFVSKNPYVLAVQIYDYEEKYNEGKAIFDMSYYVGHASSNTDVNSIHQHVYECDIDDLREFKSASKKFKDAGDPKGLVNFAVKTFSELSEKTNYTKQDALRCSIMFLAIEILEDNYNISRSVLFDSSLDRLNSLVNANRTGVIRAAIIDDEFYSFTHNRKNNKFKRQYLASSVTFKKAKDKKLFSIILDASILHDDYFTSIDKVSREFKALLRELETVYNKDNKKG